MRWMAAKGSIDTGDRNRKTVFERHLIGVGFERQPVHVDQMLPQRRQIDLGPICRRISFENGHDFGNRRKGALTSSRSA